MARFAGTYLDVIRYFNDRYLPWTHYMAGLGIPDDIFVDVFGPDAEHYKDIDMFEYPARSLRQLLLIGGTLCKARNCWGFPHPYIKYLDVCLGLFAEKLITHDMMLSYISLYVVECGGRDPDGDFIRYLKA